MKGKLKLMIIARYVHDICVVSPFWFFIVRYEQSLVMVLNALCRATALLSSLLWYTHCTSFGHYMALFFQRWCFSSLFLGRTWLWPEKHMRTLTILSASIICCCCYFFILQLLLLLRHYYCTHWVHFWSCDPQLEVHVNHVSVCKCFIFSSTLWCVCVTV